MLVTPAAIGLQFFRELGQTFRKIVKRKNRKVAVVACARKLAVLVWQLLSSGEPFRYGEPRSLQAKFFRLRVRATGRRRRSSRYGHGRTRALPSLNQVLEDNGLPQSTPPPRGERRMLDEKPAACVLHGIAGRFARGGQPRKYSSRRTEGKCKNSFDTIIDSPGLYGTVMFSLQEPSCCESASSITSRMR